MPEVVSRDGFLLGRQWRDTPDGLRIDLWASTDAEPVHVVLTGQRAVMFVDRGVQAQAAARERVELASMEGAFVDALYFDRQRDLVAERQRLIDASIEPHEADVRPVERYLMERFITGGLRVTGRATTRGGVLHFSNPRVESCDYTPALRLLSMDIETDGLTGPLLSIAGVCGDDEWVFMIGPTATTPSAPGAVPPSEQPPAQTSAAPGLSFHATPDELLSAFLAWVARLDPDVLVGWNVVEFDLQYLARLCRDLGRDLTLGRDGKRADVMTPRDGGQPWMARVPGRVVLDGIATMRSATWSFESFALDDVARELLGRGKQIDESADDRAAEIVRLFEHDKPALARYNLEDCRLVLDIFERAKLIGFAVERQRLTGLALDRQGGSVAALDQLYLPRLHRRGYVAPTVGLASRQVGSPGGYVMDSEPGLFRNVLVLDFKSLYPSIIRTFRVDPLGLSFPGDDPIPGFDGGTFARADAILPDLIATMSTARERARENQDQALSQAIKILMNSFYGVLGTPGCRFHDGRLVSSITRRGHEIITHSRDLIEARGLRVIYGDTDSLFVHVDEHLGTADCQRLGEELAASLNEHWCDRLRTTLDIESFLEIEFETHYLRFLMPTMRGSDKGSKKRYAGRVVGADGDEQIVFKGLEAVRTDWTPLARTFQRELFRRIFCDEPYEDYVREVARAVRAGELDDRLVYRKRIRRALDSYVKNVPPHVQAARKLDRPARVVEYYITTAGAEPVGHCSGRLDHGHYLERQLAPAADVILTFLGTNFAHLAGPQLPLF